MIVQLNPAIPLTVIGKGDGLALAVIDYGMEYDLLWVVAIDETGEIWTIANPKVRALKNITQGRLINEKSASEKIRFKETRKENFEGR